MNYKMIVQYDGTRYKGWQIQNSTDDTIQGKLQAILAEMSGEFVEVIGSGRTDAGVHARGQVANFHLSQKSVKRYFVSSNDKYAKLAAAKLKNDDYEQAEKYTPKSIKDYLNKHLPDDIAVVSVSKADERFHSRYNAKSKFYRYRIHTSECSNVFERKYVYNYTDLPLDIGKMQEAAKLMVGTKDFKSFCGNNKMKKSTVRTVTDVSVTKNGDEIVIDYRGEGFLQNMIRIMTGTLIEVGNGSRTVDSVSEVIAAKDRSLAGYTVPGRGLCLMEVGY